MRPFQFKILHQSMKSRARVGKIFTPHGEIDTPGFVAVGTNGTIKAIDTQMIEKIGLQLMFCNTYHLLLQPGTHVVKKAGGLHKFINRKSPLITDSGGFQIFSLAYGGVNDELKSRGKKKTDGSVLKISEEGVTFRSYRDGSKIELTPESSIEAQKALGADIIIPFDELPPYHIDPKALKESFDRTHRWEIRSLKTHLKNPQNQAIYGVVHGGIDKNLRKQSCHTLSQYAFDGYAIGGSVGKNKQELRELIDYTAPLLPSAKPIHLLGIGDLESLLATIPYGVDTFDSSYPTKAARHGQLLTKEGGIKIKQGKYNMDFGPIADDCTCPTCSHYCVAYLHHLFKAHELTGYTLASIHNLHFMVELMRQIRLAIYDDVI